MLHGITSVADQLHIWMVNMCRTQLMSGSGVSSWQREVVSPSLPISAQTTPSGQLWFLQQSTCQVNAKTSLTHFSAKWSPKIIKCFSYKVREPPVRSGSCLRKRSTQSDTALLPSDVCFLRTSSPVSWLSKTGSRTGRRAASKVKSHPSSVHQQKYKRNTFVFEMDSKMWNNSV